MLSSSGPTDRCERTNVGKQSRTPFIRRPTAIPRCLPEGTRMTRRILALVGDCYGARGGIARYNQDLFESLAAGGAELLVLPRLGDVAGLALPAGIRQWPPIFNRPLYSLVSLW